MNIKELVAAIEELAQENERLKLENEQLKAELSQNGFGFSMYARAQAAIQKKKQERIEMYKRQIDRLIKDNPDITTKELISGLDINNKTFYNLKLHEYFQNRFFGEGEGI